MLKTSPALMFCHRAMNVSSSTFCLWSQMRGQPIVIPTETLRNIHHLSSRYLTQPLFWFRPEYCLPQKQREGLNGNSVIKAFLTWGQTHNESLMFPQNSAISKSQVWKEEKLTIRLGLWGKYTADIEHFKQAETSKDNRTGQPVTLSNLQVLFPKGTENLSVKRD